MTRLQKAARRTVAHLRQWRLRRRYDPDAPLRRAALRAEPVSVLWCPTCRNTGKATVRRGNVIIACAPCPDCVEGYARPRTNITR